MPIAEDAYVTRAPGLRDDPQNPRVPRSVVFMVEGPLHPLPLEEPTMHDHPTLLPSRSRRGGIPGGTSLRWQLTFRCVATAGFCLLVATAGCNAARSGVVGGSSSVESETLVFTVGPLDLDAGADHHGTPQPEPLWDVFPRDGWVQGFRVSVHDATGDTVPSLTLHHVQVLLPQRRELLLPIPFRLMGAGAETRGAALPPGMGVPVQAGDSVLVTAMVHNPGDRSLEGVRIHLELDFLPGPPGRRMTEVYPFFLHVTPPEESSSYDLPPGRSVQSWEARPGVDGRVVALGGHLHRYAEEIRLEDAVTGQVIWRARPELDRDGNVVEVPRRHYVWTRGPRLRKDRIYRVSAVYHNPTDQVIADAGMGTLGGVFRPLGPWPERDPANPLFVLDLDRQLANGTGQDHGGHEHHRHDEP